MESLVNGEKIVLGFYYWLVVGIIDVKLGDNVKMFNFNNCLLKGLDSFMGIEYGFFKFFYIWEGCRIIGWLDFIYFNGFEINEMDIFCQDFKDDFYWENFFFRDYCCLYVELVGIDGLDVFDGSFFFDVVECCQWVIMYFDFVGIGYYNIDFYFCYLEYLVEKFGNIE